MSKKEVINRIIKENKGKHLDVLKRLQDERIREDDLPGDIEIIKQQRKDQKTSRKGD